MPNIRYINLIKKDKPIYWFVKRFFDLAISFLMIPLFIFLFLFLTISNRFWNPGSILYIQDRMGKDCKLFRAIKFRTMSDVDIIERKYSDPIEQDRITPLGRILRKYRIDEIPQIINVIKGDMSLIGPRPDYYVHAKFFLKNIDGYHERHIIRPGISGLSQIRLGYAVGLDATKNKAKVDLFYIRNASFSLDLKIFIGTLFVILRRLGN